jgi:hypothetical protein
MVDLVKEFKDITKRAKLTERLFTLYELRNILNEKINKTENKISELDLEVDKDGLDKKKEN